MLDVWNIYGMHECFLSCLPGALGSDQPPHSAVGSKTHWRAAPSPRQQPLPWPTRQQSHHNWQCRTPPCSSGPVDCTRSGSAAPDPANGAGRIGSTRSTTTGACSTLWTTFDDFDNATIDTSGARPEHFDGSLWNGDYAHASLLQPRSPWCQRPGHRRLISRSFGTHPAAKFFPPGEDVTA